MSPLTTEILSEAIRRGASDVHLLAGRPPAYRIDGSIEMAPRDPIPAAELTEMLRAAVPPAQWEKFLEERKLCISIPAPGGGHIRLTLASHLNQPEASIRLGRPALPSLAALGVPEILLDSVRRPWGLVLVTGPTGVGKTTTLNAIISRLNEEERKKIITIEDPVEFEHPDGKCLIVQQEIGLDTPSFASAVIHALRQDPDMLVIGEMRDVSTIATGLTAAETGHVVLATLHTTTADGTIARLVDAFPPEQQQQIRTQLATTLQAIFCQRLLPRADGKGRILVYELLVATDASRNLIRENKTHMLRNCIQTGISLGMRTMDQMVKDAWEAGEITWDTALSVISDRRVLGVKVG